MLFNIIMSSSIMNNIVKNVRLYESMRSYICLFVHLLCVSVCTYFHSVADTVW